MLYNEAEVTAAVVIHHQNRLYDHNVEAAPNIKQGSCFDRQFAEMVGHLNEPGYQQGSRVLRGAEPG